MSASLHNFMYEQGKELTCLCGRIFKTERGLKQHIRHPARWHEETAVGTPHGRCWSDQAKFIHSRMIKACDLGTQLPTTVEMKVKDGRATFVRYR